MLTLKEIEQRWSKLERDMPETIFTAHAKMDIDFLLKERRVFRDKLAIQILALGTSLIAMGEAYISGQPLPFHFASVSAHVERLIELKEELNK